MLEFNRPVDVLGGELRPLLMDCSRSMQANSWRVDRVLRLRLEVLKGDDKVKGTCRDVAVLCSYTWVRYGYHVAVPYKDFNFLFMIFKQFHFAGEKPEVSSIGCGPSLTCGECRKVAGKLISFKGHLAELAIQKMELSLAAAFYDLIKRSNTWSAEEQM